MEVTGSDVFRVCDDVEVFGCGLAEQAILGIISGIGAGDGSVLTLRTMAAWMTPLRGCVAACSSGG